MDAIRFDALIRSFGAATTRRGLTRLLAGLTLGGLLPPLDGDAKKHGHGKGKSEGKGKGKKAKERGVGTEGKKGGRGPATSSCRPLGQRCARRAQCCSGRCAGGTCRCKTASQCPDPGPCRTRVCTAAGACTPRPAPADTPCDDGDACTEGSRCDSQGHCVAGTAKTCDDDIDCTDDRCEPATGCVHTPNDARCPGGQVCDRLNDCACDGTHCGEGCECTGGQVCQGGTCGFDPTVSCGDDCPCPGNQVCQGGQCACPQGTRECDNDCVDTQTDPDHCGACGTACDGGGGTCRGGVCATPEVCDNADNDVDGEVDEGVLCPHNQVCQGGQCGCPEGTADCDGDDACEHLGTDEHCAGCAPCAGGQVCQGGRCACVAGQCGDACPCPGGQVCTSGACGCPAGTQNCAGNCEQLGTDQHCAACNDPCTGGQVCRGGTCVTPAVCGNGRCDPGETCNSCPGDCGACPGGTECVTDGDCVPATCCHPSWCVPVAQGPRFCGGACSGECKALTMDCGQGHCACLSGECVAVATEWCGDGVCDGGEDCLNCPADCGPCPEPECATWTDCAAEDCCHLWSCVPLAQAPVCDGIACDAGCPSPYDCGMGRCDCRGGMCVAVFNGID